MRYLLAAGLFLSPFVMQAQDCNKIVVDGANVFGSRIGEVDAVAHGLMEEGADVRVLTVAHSVNLDFDEKEAESHCMQWQSPNGGRKSTLIVLAVAPTDHKMGIYYGGSWKHALENHFDRIKKDYMAPYFKSGDFAGGMIATEKQLAYRLQADKSEAINPAVSTTLVQPTDYSGLWRVFGWIVVLGCGFGIIWMVMTALRRRKQQRIEAADAQQKATNSRNQLVAALNRMSDKLKVLNATEAETRTSQAHFDSISEEYSRMANSESFNVDADGYSAGQYSVMGDAYESLYKRLMNLPSKIDVPASEKKPVEEAPHKKYKTTHSKKESHETQVARAEASTTTVVTGMPMVVPIPIPIEEPVIVEEREEKHSRRRDDDDESSSSSSWSSGSSSSSDDSSGGGSSSWGGSDDSGGGSSDFGSSGDSSSGSGGGSSDF